jgi:small subunit ribosomal protein S16
MLKIRLQRFGRKNNPAFRVVLTDSKNAAKSGRFIEVLGNYDLKANSFVVNKESVLKRIKEGAQPSDTVHNFLVAQGIIEGQKKNVLPKKSKTTKKKDAKVS